MNPHLYIAENLFLKTILVYFEILELVFFRFQFEI